MAEPSQPWALALFRRSVLKQRKLAELITRGVDGVEAVVNELRIDPEP